MHRTFLVHHVLDQPPECTTRLRLVDFVEAELVAELRRTGCEVSLRERMHEKS